MEGATPARSTRSYEPRALSDTIYAHHHRIARIALASCETVFSMEPSVVVFHPSVV